MRLFKTFFLAFGAFLGILLDFVIDSFESHVDTEKRIFEIEQQLWQVKEFLSSSSKSSAPHLQGEDIQQLEEVVLHREVVLQVKEVLKVDKDEEDVLKVDKDKENVLKVDMDKKNVLKAD